MTSMGRTCSNKSLHLLFHFVQKYCPLSIVPSLIYLPGERLSVGVTLLLAVTVFMMLVTEMIPESSDAVPVVGRFFIFCSLLIFIIIVCVGYVNGIYNRTLNRDGPMGTWVRIYVLDKLAYVMGVRRCPDDKNIGRGVSTDVVNYESVSLASGGVSNCSDCFTEERGGERERGYISEGNLAEVNIRRSGFDDDDCCTPSDERTKIDDCSGCCGGAHCCTPSGEWHIVGKTLDRFFFVLFTLIFIFGSIWCFGSIEYSH